ncbi:hypothetical protein KSS87_011672 [Heliosperma pusillum]|nr:hypothetical protein KSS87_011672 [Heliosperma pusillum]
METKMSQYKRGFYVVIALLMMCYFSMACNTTKATTKMQVTGFYIFGDSLVDNGNNNEILTLARANYQPYGIDYPIGPTGRFCNGKTIVDALGELLGFKEEIPPFSRAKRFEVLDKGCCGVGKNNGQITCLPLQAPCDDRKKYIFWDAFHPTEIVNIVLAKKAFTSKSKSYAYPINVKQLAML